MPTTNRKAVGLLMEHMERSARRKETRTFKAHEPDHRVAGFTLSYLDAFGYLKEELARWKDISVGDIIDAIKSFQGFFGLKKTGELCVKTVRAMEQPRCGCPDIVRPWQPYAEMRAFAKANLAKWQKAQLTYAVADYLPGLPKADLDAQLLQAFRAWTRYGNIDVAPTAAGRADIVLSVGRGRQSNFDGPGGTLAWAYLPNGQDGQLLMRFDLDETWILQPNQRGILVLNVATHEFGHLFGLDHSRVEQALMAPYYNPAVATPQQNDDIPRFQARYGVRTTPAPEPAPTPAPGLRRMTVDLAPGSLVTVDGRSV
jgi:hypothetical protein